MENLKYLKKIIEPEIERFNQKIKYIKKTQNINTSTKTFKTKYLVEDGKFKDGGTFTAPIFKDIFKLLTENTGYDLPFSSALVIPNEYILLEGYSLRMIIDQKKYKYIEIDDPYVKINDFGVIKANVGAKTKDMKNILNEMNEKLQNFIRDKLSYRDMLQYNAELYDYQNPQKKRLKKYLEEGNFIDLE